MALSDVLICQRALAKLGDKDITSLTDGSPQAKWCNRHYETTRDTLLMLLEPPFATRRAELSEDSVTPDFGYDYQFLLPSDFLSVLRVYYDSGVPNQNTPYSYALEGDKLLFDTDALELIYIRRVEDETKFDPVFVEVFIQQMAVNLCMPLTTKAAMYERLQKELQAMIRQAKMIYRNRGSHLGRSDVVTWVEAKLYNR